MIRRLSIGVVILVTAALSISTCSNLQAQQQTVRPILVEQLSNARTAEAAASALEQFGPQAAPATAALVRLLSSNDEQQRARAIAALAKIGPGAAAAAADLAKLVESDPSEENRKSALEAILAIVPDRPEATQLLMAALENDDRSVLEHIKKDWPKSLPLLAAALYSKNKDIQEDAREIANELKIKRADAPQYVAALANKDEHVRYFAAAALARIGGHFAEIVPVAVQACLAADEVDPDIQQILNNCGRRDVPLLLAAINDDKAAAEVRIRACRRLVSAARSPRLAAQIKPALSAADPALHGWVVLAIASIDPPSRDLAGLTKNLKSEDNQLRKLSAGAMDGRRMANSSLDPAAASALCAALSDKDEGVRKEASWSLATCELTPALVEGIATALQNEISRGSALYVLSVAQDPPLSLMPKVLKAAEDADKNKAQLAVAALRRFGTAAVPTLISIAGDGKAAPQLRLFAIRALGEIKSPPRDALRALAQIVMSQDRTLRAEAAASLAIQGVADPKVLDALVESAAENHNRRDFDNQSYVAFAALGPRAAPAIPTLLALLTTDNAQSAASPLAAIARDSLPVAAAVVRRYFAVNDEKRDHRLAFSIQMFGKSAVPPLVEMLKSKNDNDVIAAVELLEQIGKPAAAAVPELKQLLARKGKVQLAAAKALAEIAPKTDGLLPALIVVLEKTPRDADPFFKIVDALGKLGPAAAPAVEKLIPLLDDDEGAQSAMMALGSIGPGAAPAVPKLIKLLNDDGRWDAGNLCGDAMNALGKIGEPAKAAVPVLVALLGNEDYRWGAASALGHLGPSAQAAVPALEKMLNDENELPDAARLAGSLGREGATLVPKLLRLLDSNDSEVQSAAAIALGQIGPAAADAVPKLLSLLKAKGIEMEVRSYSADALGLIKSPAALPELIADFSTGDELLIDNATRAIEFYGPAAQSALPACVKALHDKSRVGCAVAILTSLGPAAAPATDDLIAMLATPPHGDRGVVISALGAIGPAAKRALPQLEPLLLSKDPEERRTAAKAIGKIDRSRATDEGED